MPLTHLLRRPSEAFALPHLFHLGQFVTVATLSQKQVIAVSEHYMTLSRETAILTTDGPVSRSQRCPEAINTPHRPAADSDPTRRYPAVLH